MYVFLFIYSSCYTSPEAIIEGSKINGKETVFYIN